MLYRYLIIGLNIEYNVDAELQRSEVTLAEDLFASTDVEKLMSQTKSSWPNAAGAHSDGYEPGLTVELWRVHGCSPVLVLKLKDPDRSASTTEIANLALVNVECSELVTEFLDAVDITLEDRNLGRLFPQDNLPFEIVDGAKQPIGQNRTLDDEPLPRLFVPMSSEGAGRVAAAVISQAQPISPDELATAVVLIGVRASRSRLIRATVSWMNGPADGDDDTAHAWHSTGTRLLQGAISTSTTGRALGTRSLPWGSHGKNEMEFTGQLLKETSVLIPPMQHANYQERMGTLESRKERTKADAAAVAEHRKDREDRDAARRAEDDKRSQQRLVLGSIFVTWITILALVPTIGSLDESRMETWMGPWGAWGTTVSFVLPVALVLAILLFWSQIKSWLIRIRAGISGRRTSPPVQISQPNIDSSATDLSSGRSGSGPEPALRVHTPEGDRGAILTEHEESQANPQTQVVDSQGHSPVNSIGRIRGSAQDKSAHFSIQRKSGVRAEAVELDSGEYLVLKGALARRNTLASTTEPINEIREELLQAGALRPGEDPNLLELVSDRVFASLSQAAGVFLGRSTIGAKEWVRQDRDAIELVSLENTPKPGPLGESNELSEVDSTSEPLLQTSSFTLKSGNSLVQATGTYNFGTKRFNVSKGSTTRPDHAQSLQQSYIDKRDELMFNGTLFRADSRAWELRSDIEFQSSSAAASVFLGRSASGKYFWIEDSSQLTLSEAESARENLDADIALGGNRPAETTSEVNGDEPLLWRSSGPGGITAQGIFLEGKRFKVLAGSRIRFDSLPSMQRNYVQLKNSLVLEGKLIDRATYYELSESVEFSSPSQAAGVVLGRNSNGLIEWTNESGTLADHLESLESVEL